MGKSMAASREQMVFIREYNKSTFEDYLQKDQPGGSICILKNRIVREYIKGCISRTL